MIYGSAAPSGLNVNKLNHEGLDPMEVDNVAGKFLCITVNDSRELVCRGDQVADYVQCGHKIDDVNVWDFICQIEKQKKKSADHPAVIYRGNVDSDDDDFTEQNGRPHTNRTNMLDEDDNSLLGVSTINLLPAHPENESHKLRV